MGSVSDKHEAEVEHLTQYTKTVRAYLASQLELEMALTELMNKLEAAGTSNALRQMQVGR